MTIGIDASRANRTQKTGVEWYAHDLIEALKRVIPSTVSVVLYSDTPLAGRLGLLPTHWESRVLAWPPKRLWTILRLSYEMFKRPPDVLFVPSSALPLVTPRRTVTTLHDIGFVQVPEAYRVRSRWYLRFNAWRTVRRCKIVLTISTWMQQQIKDVYGISSDRLVVTPLAARAAASTEDSGAVAIRYGIKGPYFFFSGRYEYKKNLDTIVPAFARFRATDASGHSLVLCGTRGYGAALVDRVLTVVGRERVVELSWIPESDRAALLAGATALVFPTRYEGFGLPILEAFAAGVPVITSSNSATAEVAGEAALLVDPSSVQKITDAMARLAEDSALREQLIAAGKIRVAAFTWERTAQLTWRALMLAAVGKD
ncbi:MAG: glycosyltransferase family 1 protein [Patescibacteria group bacterium]